VKNAEGVFLDDSLFCCSVTVSHVSAEGMSASGSDKAQSAGVVSRSDALKLASNVPLSSTPSSDNVASWTSDDVEKWLRCCNLDFATDR
jgi:hypothetical protein